jgi:putative transposase
MQTFKGKLKLNKTQKRLVDETIINCVSMHNEILALAFEQEAYPDFTSLGMFYSLSDAPAVIAQSQIRVTCNALDRWIRGDKNGKRSGRPRVKVEKTATNSFSFPITDSRHVRQFGGKVSVQIPKIGKVRALFSDRPITGNVKRACVKKDSCGTYWLTVITDNNRKVELPTPLTPDIGVDLGIKTTVSASNVDGSVVVQPERKKFLDERNLAALKHASNHDRKSLPFVHRKIARRRDDYNWKLARKVVSSANNIYVGNVAVKWLISGRLARQASDIALSDLKQKMSYLAASAGRRFEEVNEAWTSKTCSNCGTIKKDLTLRDRVFACSCGLILDRDLNAARNIANIGRLQYLNEKVRANNKDSSSSVPSKKGEVC